MIDCSFFLCIGSNGSDPRFRDNNNVDVGVRTRETLKDCVCYGVGSMYVVAENA